MLRNGKPGLLIAAALLIGTTACDDAIDRIRRADPGGSGFSAALAREYRALAIFESDEMFDHGDAGLFARKGLMAARGETVLPEEASGWELSPENAEAVAEARARLLELLDGGARTGGAEAAARTQVKFDCWVEQLEENFQNDHIAACRDPFFRALSSTGGAFAPLPGTPPPGMPPPRALQSGAPVETEATRAARSFLVFFDFDSVLPDADGAEVVDIAAGLAATGSCREAMITAAGHADTMAPRRQHGVVDAARAVQRRLVARGLDPARIRAMARGEGGLRIATPGQTRGAKNRGAKNREVEIEIAP